MKYMMMAVLFVMTSLGVTYGGQDGIDSVTFASESWALATEKDGTGLYWDIFRAVYEPVGIKVNTMIRSYEGSVNLLEAKSVDAMVGAYEDEIEDGIYPKHHFAVDIVAAAGKKANMASWKGQKTIENKNVGWITGYSYDEYLDVKVNKKTVVSREAAFHLLDIGKLDYFLDAKSDIEDFFGTGKVNRDGYVTQTLLELKLFTVFANNDKGKKLADIFDRRFSELLEKGEIKALFQHYIQDRKGNFSNPF